MNTLKRRNLLSRVDDKVMWASIFFVGIAFFTTCVKADVKSVEQLEFTRVVLVGNNELEFTQADESILKIRGDGRKLNPVPFLLRGDTLQLGVNQDGHEVKRIKYKLSAPTLEALKVEGSGEAYIKPLLVADLVVAVEGSGDIRMYDVSAEQLEMRVAGSGAVQAVNVVARDAKLTLKGSGDILLGSLKAETVRTYVQGSGDIRIQDDSTAEFVDISVMGSGDTNLGKLRATVCNVSIIGSGDVKVRVAEELDAEIMGSGDLQYWGNPRTSTSVLGSGDIVQRD